MTYERKFGECILLAAESPYCGYVVATPYKQTSSHFPHKIHEIQAPISWVIQMLGLTRRWWDSPSTEIRRTSCCRVWFGTTKQSAALSYCCNLTTGTCSRKSSPVLNFKVCNPLVWLEARRYYSTVVPLYKFIQGGSGLLASLVIKCCRKYGDLSQSSGTPRYEVLYRLQKCNMTYS